MKQENAYILLQLAIFPPENDPKTIDAAIKSKQGEWSNLRNHSTKGILAKSYLEMVPKLKAVMADDGERKQQAQEARDIILSDLANDLNLLSAKQYITQNELDHLTRTFPLVPQQMIRQQIKVPIKEKPVEKEAPQTLPSTDQKNIAKGLDFIGKTSLYDFLGASPQADLPELNQKTDQMDKAIKQKSSKDAHLTECQNLVGYCMKVFKTKEMRKKYDATHTLQRFARLDKRIILVAKDKHITAEEFDALLKEALTMGLNQRESQEYIFDYAVKKGWKVSLPHPSAPEKKQTCPHCNLQTSAAAARCQHCGFSFPHMPQVLRLLREAKQAGDDGHIPQAIKLVQQGLSIWPNHPESLFLLEELKERETRTATLSQRFNARNLLKQQGVTALIIGLAAVTLPSLSAVTVIKDFINLIKTQTYTGNAPLIAAMALTFIICALLLGWAVPFLLSALKQLKGTPTPISPQFDVHNDLRYALARNSLKPGKTALQYLVRRDKTFLTAAAVFTGVLTLFFIAKLFISNEFFWNLGMTPEFFSFPLILTLLLATAAALRGASLYYHRPGLTRPHTPRHLAKTVTTTHAPHTFAPRIKQKTALMEQKGSPNILHHSGFSQNSDTPNSPEQIEAGLFIETIPRYTPFLRPQFIYSYLAAAVLLSVVGFLMITQAPAGNLSVLSVPTIALGYVWSIIKGGLLIYAGLDLYTAAAPLSRVRGFQSVAAYVKITGQKKKNTYRFDIFTASLRSELDTLTGNRQIISINQNQEAQNAETLVNDAIASFGAA